MATEYIPRLKSGSDEIDLIELFQGIWAQKWLALVVALLVTSCAAAYAWLSEPVYEASVSVMPPALSDVEGFNLGRENGSGLRTFTPGSVYAVFKRNLVSDETKRRFFREVYLPAVQDRSKGKVQEAHYKDFLEGLRIQVSDKTQPERYTLYIQYHDPKVAAEWLSQYVAIVSKDSLDDMLRNSKSQVSMKSEGIRRKINIMRESAKTLREDRLAQLKEALLAAEAVGLDNPPVITSQLAKQLSAVMEGDLMYMRGTKALRAEIRLLESRGTDDPFIPGLRALEERLALFNGIQIDPATVSVFSMDGVIEEPELPIKPRRGLVLLIGLVAGVVLGGLVALVQFMALKRRLAFDERL